MSDHTLTVGTTNVAFYPYDVVSTTTNTSNTISAGWTQSYGPIVVEKEVIREVEKPRRQRMKVVEEPEVPVYAVSNLVVESNGGVKSIKHYVLVLEEAGFCTSCRSVECIHAAEVNDLLWPVPATAEA